MKHFILAALAIGTAFAAPSNLGDLGLLGGSSAPVTDPGTDDVILNQPFNFSTLTNGLGISAMNGWMSADDFTPAANATMGYIEIWMIYPSSQEQNFSVQVRNDTGGSGPGSTLLFDYTATPWTHTNTGYSQWGYVLYYSTHTMTTTHNVTGGTKVWFALQTDNTSTYNYWLCANQAWADQEYWSSNNGTSWQTSTQAFGVAYEHFFVLSTPTSLSRDTWGAIKTVF